MCYYLVWDVLLLVLYVVFAITLFMLCQYDVCDDSVCDVSLLCVGYAKKTLYTAQNKYVCTRLFAFFDILNLLFKEKVYIFLKLVQFPIQL